MSLAQVRLPRPHPNKHSATAQERPVNGVFLQRARQKRFIYIQLRPMRPVPRQQANQSSRLDLVEENADFVRQGEKETGQLFPRLDLFVKPFSGLVQWRQDQRFALENANHGDNQKNRSDPPEQARPRHAAAGNETQESQQHANRRDSELQDQSLGRVKTNF